METNGLALDMQDLGVMQLLLYTWEQGGLITEA